MTGSRALRRHHPHGGITTYIEEINGYKVGFIKYRVAGTRDHDFPLPRSVIHAMLLKDGRLYFVFSIVLYAGIRTR